MAPFWQNIVSTATSICGLAIAFYSIYKIFIKKWVIKRRERKKAELQAEQKVIMDVMKDELIKEFGKQNENIKLIKDKLYPNGGTSIDDKVGQILVQMKELRSGQLNTWEIMDVAIWNSDAGGRTTYVNKPYCELVRCIPTDVMGLSWLGLIAKFDRDRVEKEWEKSIANASDFDLCYSFELPGGLFQKVNGIAIHNKNKLTGKLENSIGRLIKIGEPTKDVSKTHTSSHY